MEYNYWRTDDNQSTRWKSTINEEYPDGEDARAVLHRRDAVLRKAKEYKNELDHLQVSGSFVYLCFPI